MDTPTDAAESEASSSPDPAVSPRASEHHDSAAPYMNRESSEILMEHIDAHTNRAERTSNGGEEDDPFLNPVSQTALFHRSIPRTWNEMASTSDSINIWDHRHRVFQSTYTESDSEESRSMQEPAGVSHNIGPQTELGNSRANSSGFPLQTNPGMSRQRYDYLFSHHHPSSSSEVPSSSNTNLSSPSQAHGTLGNNTMDPMSPYQNVLASRPTRGSGTHASRSSRRCRRDVQSADDLTPREPDRLEQNIQSLRRRARRTEITPGRIPARTVFMGPSTGAYSQVNTLNSIHGPSGNDDGGIRSNAMRAYSSIHRQRLEYDVLSRERIQSSRDDAARSLEANFGPPQNNPRTPRGLDDKTDKRPKAKEAKELVVDLECRACMTQLVDTAFLPCGHAVLCRWCADQHMPPHSMNLTLCPMCRKSVSDKVRLFFS